MPSPIPFKDSVYHRILAADIPEVSPAPAGVRAHFAGMAAFMADVPASLKDFAYAPGKWTVAQVLGHLVDTQTVMLYRILSIARGGEEPLPPFDENLWVDSGNYGVLGLEAIQSHYAAAAAHTLSVALRLRPEDRGRLGVANNVLISAEEALIYLMAHERHHMKTLQERYLDGRV